MSYVTVFAYLVSARYHAPVRCPHICALLRAFNGNRSSFGLKAKEWMSNLFCWATLLATHHIPL